ncbi:hypothetical protein Syun_009635 [Stephania yunnanensis]|uniref:Uncharacterized protein n=1 Tax=Stephania yunnanensis TaxID=152371 RepID=A0AAP0KEU0_9MAGN
MTALPLVYTLGDTNGKQKEKYNIVTNHNFHDSPNPRSRADLLPSPEEGESCKLW